MQNSTPPKNLIPVISFASPLRYPHRRESRCLECKCLFNQYFNVYLWIPAYAGMTVLSVSDGLKIFLQRSQAVPQRPSERLCMPGRYGLMRYNSIFIYIR